MSTSAQQPPARDTASAPEDWERRVADLWTAFDDHDPADFLAAMATLAAELPAGDPIASFELASAYDATDHEEEAAPLYRAALDAGLSGPRRRQAWIQLASTLRNLGRAEEGVALLTAERDAASDELDDAVAAFLALALVDVGREREAVALALSALSRHLPMYNRSLAHYADELAARAGR
ncbi:tetratricopeptide repeat protein [Streptomyces sparsogenes]|uniref:tetratricopeptide repeat protein n=1 Tax=Streptomyces sparsogenes TaxID=67365 RepID=UPI003326969D